MRRAGGKRRIRATVGIGLATVLLAVMAACRHQDEERAAPTRIVFFGARDADGPFVRVESVQRGEWEGGQWSWDRCVYPYPHSMPAAAPPCPG